MPTLVLVPHVHVMLFKQLFLILPPAIIYSSLRLIFTRVMCPCIPESQPYPGPHPKNGGQQGKGGDPTSLLCTCETPPGLLCSALGPLAWKMWKERFHRRATKMIYELDAWIENLCLDCLDFSGTVSPKWASLNSPHSYLYLGMENGTEELAIFSKPVF